MKKMKTFLTILVFSATTLCMVACTNQGKNNADESAPIQNTPNPTTTDNNDVGKEDSPDGVIDDLGTGAGNVIEDVGNGVDNALDSAGDVISDVTDSVGDATTDASDRR